MGLINSITVATRWSSISQIGQSPLVRSAALVPIIGYFILLNEDIHDQLTLTIKAEIKWRLYAIYLGLSCIGFASIIFQLSCPQIIKRHPTPVDYINHFNAYAVQHNFKETLRGLTLRRYRKNPRFWQSASALEDALISAEPSTSGVLMNYWIAECEAHLYARFACLLLYFVGFITIMIPSLVTFWDVLMFIVKDTLS